MREAPIIVELRGRLGNQLFQFAAGYAAARRHDARLLFSSRRLKRGEPLSLPQFIGPRYREASRAQLLRFGRLELDVPGRDAVNGALGAGLLLAGRVRNHPYVIEQRGHAHILDRRMMDARPPCLVRGVFPSEQYFADYADEVAAAICLPPVAAQLSHLPRPLVGVHFRRGDFNSLGWALPLEYYDAALTLLSEQITPGTLLLSSDDHAFTQLVTPWIARFGPVHDTRTLAGGLEGNVAALAACDHHVIANSTYSWWAAWLGERRGRPGEHLVYAPGDWQRPYETEDSIPERWHAVTW